MIIKEIDKLEITFYNASHQGLIFRIDSPNLTRDLFYQFLDYHSRSGC